MGLEKLRVFSVAIGILAVAACQAQGQTCTYSLSFPQGMILSGGSSGYTGLNHLDVRVVASSSSCRWSASGMPNWLTATPSQGTGSAGVRFSAPSNQAAKRIATFSIGGASGRLVQEAYVPYTVAGGGGAGILSVGGPGDTACTARFPDLTRNLAVPGRSQTVQIELVGANCFWESGLTSADWLSVDVSKNGSTNIKSTLNINTHNAEQEARDGIIIVDAKVTTGGVPFSIIMGVKQAPNESCEFTTTMSTMEIPQGGTSGQLWPIRRSRGNCELLPSVAENWLYFSKIDSNQGITINAGANNGTQSRSVEVSAAGKTLLVTQLGQSCSVTLDRNQLPATAAGGSAHFNIKTNFGNCPWSVTSGSTASWLTLQSIRSGSGPAAFQVNIAANPTTQSRSASFQIAGTTVTVTQEALSCEYTISPTALSLGGAAGQVEIRVSTGAGCSLTSSLTSGWSRVSAGAVLNGTGTVVVSHDANESGSSRTANLVLASTRGTERVIAITQAAAGCHYNVSPPSFRAEANGGDFNLQISASQANCSWEIRSLAAWITVQGPAQRSGSATVSFSVARNDGAQQRNGALQVGADTVSVAQQGTSSVSFTAEPEIITNCVSAGVGVLKLSWDTAGRPAQLRLNSTTGPLVSDSLGMGTATTGPWVGDGLIFVLVERATGAELARHRATVRCGGEDPNRRPIVDPVVPPGVFLSPNPLPGCAATLPKAKVQWYAPGQTRTKLFARAPGGTPLLLALGEASGEYESGQWVGEGLIFYVTDVNDKELYRSTATLDRSCGTIVSRAAVVLQGGDGCEGGTEWTVLSTNFEQTYFKLRMTSLPGGAWAQVQFRNPDGDLARSVPLALDGRSSYCGSIPFPMLRTQQQFLDGIPPAGWSPGQWEIRVVVNGTPVATRVIQVESPVSLITHHIRNSVPPSNDPCRVDPTVYLFYSGSSANAYNYFWVKDAKPGDQYISAWFHEREPGGGVWMPYRDEIYFQPIERAGGYCFWNWVPTDSRYLLFQGSGAWRARVGLLRNGQLSILSDAYLMANY